MFPLQLSSPFPTDTSDSPASVNPREAAVSATDLWNSLCSWCLLGGSQLSAWPSHAAMATPQQRGLSLQEVAGGLAASLSQHGEGFPAGKVEGLLSGWYQWVHSDTPPWKSLCPYGRLRSTLIPAWLDPVGTDTLGPLNGPSPI